MRKEGSAEKVVQDIRRKTRREQIKQRTLTARRRENLRTPHHAAQQPEVSLLQQPQWSGLV